MIPMVVTISWALAAFEQMKYPLEKGDSSYWFMDATVDVKYQFTCFCPKIES